MRDCFSPESVKPYWQPRSFWSVCVLEGIRLVNESYVQSMATIVMQTDARCRSTWRKPIEDFVVIRPIMFNKRSTSTRKWTLSERMEEGRVRSVYPRIQYAKATDGNRHWQWQHRWMERALWLILRTVLRFEILFERAKVGFIRSLARIFILSFRTSQPSSYQTLERSFQCLWSRIEQHYSFDRVRHGGSISWTRSNRRRASRYS